MVNPYKVPAETWREESHRDLGKFVAVFCFGWAFGTATRLQLDTFGWAGVAALLIGIVLWQMSYNGHQELLPTQR